MDVGICSVTATICSVVEAGALIGVALKKLMVVG